MQEFWTELVRRKVVRVAITYIAVAWVLIQVADVALESFGAPEYFMQAFMLFAILGVPIVLVLSWALEVTPTGIRRERAAATNVSNLRQAIAVLPFANMSSDQEVDHIADGLSDNIITVCQQQLDLDVTSRNSTFVYKNQPVSITNVAKELDVAYVLEGSIQKQAENLRVTAQLINAADDSHLWADHFDRVLQDAFKLQDELSDSIVAQIKASLPTSGIEDNSADSAKPASLFVTVMNLPSVVLFTGVGILLFLLVISAVSFMPAPDTSDLAGSLTFGVMAAVLLASIAGLFALYMTAQRRASQQDTEVILQEINQHVQHNHMAEAFDLAESIVGGSAPVDDEDWWDVFSCRGSIKTSPVGATITWRPYNGRNVPWRALSNSPVNDVRLPLGPLQIRLEHAGYVTQEFAVSNPCIQLHNSVLANIDIPGYEAAQVFSLSQHEEPGMVFASECFTVLGLTGMPYHEPEALAPFYIDKYPVTNADFQAFVDASGYGEAKYWENLPWPAGTRWQEAVAGFVDRTEQTGPADWELGHYPAGEADFPVSGVSWFEAAAYAHYVGKRLPAVNEWARAALPPDAGTSNISVAMMNFSNFLARGKSRVGEFPSLNAAGAYDMFGNVREWAFNEVGDGRANLGGGDRDLAYFAVWLNSEDPLQRDTHHGFRCARGEVDQRWLDPIDRMDRDYEGEAPASDEVFDALVQPLLPSRRPTHAELQEEMTLPDGNLSQHFEVDTGYGGRMQLYVVRPPGQQARPALVFFPGMGSFMGAKAEDDIPDYLEHVSFIIDQLGYAIVVPEWSGAFERFDGGPFPQGEGVDTRSVWLTRMSHWVQEASQAITFAEEQEWLDADRIGFFGTSYGANTTMPLLALEPRFKTAILLSGNLLSHRMFPFADAINFLPRITLPTLMINGRYDTIVSARQELFDLRMKWLATPDEDKRQVLFDAGHFPFPQHLLKKTLAQWLTRYL